MHDIDEALVVARAASQAGADFLEIGDPLIKRTGLIAVERIKQQVPHTPLVVEMMSSDWGRGTSTTASPEPIPSTAPASCVPGHNCPWRSPASSVPPTTP